MNKKLVKTPSGLPVGEAVTTENGELGLIIQHGSMSEMVSLTYVKEQISIKLNKLNTQKLNSRNTEQGA